MLASRPEEIHDDELRRTIVALNEQGGGMFFVAEEAGVIVGHGLLEAYKLAVTAHVVALTLVVHEGHQGRGVGRSLMNALIEWARASSRVEKIELRVRSSNERALALYRALGFVEEGRFKHRIKLGPQTYLDDVSMGLWVGAQAFTG
jgi:ribosomal protein S18 acetylase RimI-like enzyme